MKTHRAAIINPVETDALLRTIDTYDGYALRRLHRRSTATMR